MRSQTNRGQHSTPKQILVELTDHSERVQGVALELTGVT